MPQERPQLFSSASDEWATPRDLFVCLDAEFHFNLDAAALPSNALCRWSFSPWDDGLAHHWPGRVWLNPPYGRQIGRWVEKARMEAARGSLVVCLLPARTDTRWWWESCTYGEIRFLPGRLRFGGGDSGAPFPSAVVVFHPYLPPSTRSVLWWDWRSIHKI